MHINFLLCVLAGLLPAFEACPLLSGEGDPARCPFAANKRSRSRSLHAIDEKLMSLVDSLHDDVHHVARDNTHDDVTLLDDIAEIDDDHEASDSAPSMVAETSRRNQQRNRRQRRRRTSAPPPPTSEASAGSWFGGCKRWRVLKQRDFKRGTRILRRSGTASNPRCYRLNEDVTMTPTGSGLENRPGLKMIPKLDNSRYLPSESYWLGFHSAIAIAADYIVIDLNGKRLEMSREFDLRQRFFSLITLGNKPFRASTGPPQFSADESELRAANHVIIKNGRLGRTSHMGIHGNDNIDVSHQPCSLCSVPNLCSLISHPPLHTLTALAAQVLIANVTISGFETGGIQLNGAQSCLNPALSVNNEWASLVWQLTILGVVV